MKKAVVAILVLLFVLVLFAGCDSGALPADLYVIAEDKTDVAAGEYTLEYAINKYEAYRSKYSLNVTVNVYDENNVSVPVQNNRTITVEADKTYTAVISVYGDVGGKQEVLSGQYVFVAVKSPRMLSFLYPSGEVYKQFKVLYGTDFPMDAVPEVPNLYPSTGSAANTQIRSKCWMIKEGSTYESLTEEHLRALTVDKQIYAVYEYVSTPIPYVVTFVSEGEVVSTVNADSQTTPVKPDIPAREGYTLLGWCVDEACRTYYDWRLADPLRADLTLYARWVKNTESPTPDNRFVFTKQTDDYGNDYYVVAARDVQTLTGDLVIPNNHDGLPVRYIAEKGFENALIDSVAIPNTVLLDNQRAFSNCRNLVSVTFERGNESTVVSSRCFSQCVLLMEIVLPDTVTRIQPNAFTNCLSLSAVTLSDSLYAITDGAFSGCSSLMSVSLPSRVENVLANAFSSCSSLSSLTVEADTALRHVDPTAFSETALIEVILPERLREMQFVFGDATVLYQ